MHDTKTVAPQLYFFQVVTNGVKLHASDGLLFESRALVWQEASEPTGQIIRDMDEKIESGLDWRMDVADETGNVIFSIQLQGQRLGTALAHILESPHCGDQVLHEIGLGQE